MFKNPKKIQKFPEGTFIPTKARLFAILQLCIAFSSLFWILGKPITEEIFLLKRHASMYENLLHRKEYQFLMNSKKQEIEANYFKVKNLFQNNSTVNKVKKSIIYFSQHSLYKIFWIFFGVMIPIMLLRKSPKALTWIWILPVLTSLHFLDQLYFHEKQLLSFEEQLFPSERELIDNFLTVPLSKNIFNQKIQLENAFQKYLNEKWSKNDVLTTKELYPEFLFNVARFDAFSKDILRESSIHKYPKEHFLLLITFLFWSYLFSINCYKSLKM